LTTQPRDLLDLFASQRQFSGYGPDVTFLDTALAHVFSTIAIDPARISAVGFSDGGTYALSIGLANGDLFHKIVGFSPGFILNGPRRGRPEIFVSHGRSDQILPIERTGRRVVAELRQQAYDLLYREFDGGHQIPDTIAREAIAWAVG
jgi:predicted esterase